MVEQEADELLKKFIYILPPSHPLLLPFERTQELLL